MLKYRNSLSFNEAAQRLGISIDLLERNRQLNNLCMYRMRGGFRFDRADINKLARHGFRIDQNA